MDKELMEDLKDELESRYMMLMLGPCLDEFSYDIVKRLGELIKSLEEKLA